MSKTNYDIKVEGLNFDRLLREFNRLNITLFNVNKPSYKVMEFSITTLDYLKLKKIGILKNYKMQIISKRGIPKLKYGILKHLALTITGVVCFVIFLIFSNFTFKINVLGLETIKEQEIIELLKTYNVKTNQINHKSNEEIEKFLKQNNEKISLVSVIKKGTNLIINIKEKVDVITDTTPITAPYNMQITKLNVKQGTTKFKVGDIVKKGEIIVSSSTILSNGQTVNLTPIAEVEGETWINGTAEFETNKTELVRTGKKQKFSYFDFLGNKLFYKIPAVKFEKFEEVVYNDYIFKNWFLPIKFVKTTYYELKEKTTSYNFEENKEKLLKKSETLAYQNLPEGKSVLEKNTVINQVDSKYFVTTYLKINIVL